MNNKHILEFSRDDETQEEEEFINYFHFVAEEKNKKIKNKK